MKIADSFVKRKLCGGNLLTLCVGRRWCEMRWRGISAWREEDCSYLEIDMGGGGLDYAADVKNVPQKSNKCLMKMHE